MSLMTMCSLKKDDAHRPVVNATRRPFGLGSVSDTKVELGNVSSVVVDPAVGSKLTAIPEQLFGAGPQPATLLVHRGPVLVVIHTLPRLSACGSATCAPAGLGTLFSGRSRRPSLSENSSSTVLLPQAHAGHSEMNEAARAVSLRASRRTDGADLG